MGAAIVLIQDPLIIATAQHIWMADAMGLMTLAIMTRVRFGHTGREIQADGLTTALYTAGIITVVLRVAAGLMPYFMLTLYVFSAIF